MINKVPPSSPEAERHVLGSLLISPDAADDVIDAVTPTDFYDNNNMAVFSAMVKLYQKNVVIDIVSVSQELGESLPSIGGMTHLISLSNEVATAANVLHYATVVANKSNLRRLLKAATQITALSYDPDNQAEEVMNTAESLIFDISTKSAKSDFAEVGGLLETAYARMEELANNDGALRGIPSGFSGLDGLLSGLQKTDLIVLAARPAVGKTTFALDIARETAAKYGKSVAIFSLEMGKDQLTDRLLCSQGHVSLFDMRNGNLETGDYARISGAMAELDRAKIFIDDNANCTVANIRTKSRKLAAKGNLDLIIVDYIQLMNGSGNGGNRNNEIGEISRGLKLIAKELEVPLIALSQLSRGVESRRPSIPMLSDLRDSGAIEQDADIVMFLYRKAADSNYERNSLFSQELTSGKCIVSKQRNGPTGEVDLFFDSVSVSYKNLK